MTDESAVIRPKSHRIIVAAILTCACVVCAVMLQKVPGSNAGQRAAQSTAQQAVDDPGHPNSRFAQWRDIEDIPTGIAQYETVFWQPEDTVSLRKLIRESELVAGKRVLEIGTGTGLVALCCLIHGAEHVVATDINPHAIRNAKFNAQRFPVTSSLQTRLVSEEDPGAFAVIGDGERFDLIVSNPPWEDGVPAIVDEYALYDPQFALLESLLAGLDEHLAPDGRVLLAYGCVEGIRVLQQRAPVYGWEVEALDERNLDELPNLFLPGMLLELKRTGTN